MKQFISTPLLFLCSLLSLALLNGCSYYTNVNRQADLDINLAKYRNTMQLPATNTQPAQYQMCDDRLYPCPLMTPLHFQATDLMTVTTPTVLAVQHHFNQTSLYTIHPRKMPCSTSHLN